MSGFGVIFFIFMALAVMSVSCLMRFFASDGEDAMQLLLAIGASIPAAMFVLLAACEASANDE